MHRTIITTLGGYDDDDQRFLVMVYDDQSTSRRVEGEHGFLSLLRQAVSSIPHDPILLQWLAEAKAKLHHQRNATKGAVQIHKTIEQEIGTLDGADALCLY